MAARKSTASKSRAPRSLPGPPSVNALASLEDAVDRERLHLMKAHSLLQCIDLAIEAGGALQPVGASGPYFPDVVELAADLVRASINRLDLLLLQRNPA